MAVSPPIVSAATAAFRTSAHCGINATKTRKTSPRLENDAEGSTSKEAKRDLIVTLVTGIAAVSDAANTATIAQAATASVDNNYLTQDQWRTYAKMRKECGADPICVKGVDKQYAEISGKQDAELANCDQSGACKTLRNEVAKGREEMLALVGANQLPDSFLGARDLQMLGEKLASSPALRRQISRALEAQRVCDTDPARCDEQALKAALTVATVVGGAATAAALLRTAPALASAATISVEACLTNLVLCANKAAIAFTEVAAGDALGGAALTAGAAGGLGGKAIKSGLLAVTELSPVAPTASGLFSATKFNSAGFALTDLTAAEKAIAAKVAAGGDAEGKLTELLIDTVAQRQGLTALIGGRYASNNGFDHVFQNSDGVIPPELRAFRSRVTRPWPAAALA